MPERHLQGTRPPTADQRHSDATAAAGGDGAESVPGERGQDLTTLAYERIEELFVAMRIAPGAYLRTQDLQTRTGLGRTPVHQAVRRLAAETLLDVRPRNGLRVAPIDLSRERRLAEVRRDLNRFVTEASIHNMTSNDRVRLLHLKRRLQAGADTMTVDAFNEIDKAFDTLLIHASGERFLERALRPLHAFARRIGYLHLSRISGAAGLARTIERHFAIMDAVLAGNAAAARATSDELVVFGISMIDELEEAIDPSLLDVSFAAPEETPSGDAWASDGRPVPVAGEQVSKPA